MSSRLETSVRILLVLLGFLGIFFAPWWVPLACMALLALRFSAWEVPLIGFMMDLMWHVGGGAMPLPVFTCIGIVLVLLTAPMRKQFLL